MSVMKSLGEGQRLLFQAERNHNFKLQVYSQVYMLFLISHCESNLLQVKDLKH